MIDDVVIFFNQLPMYAKITLGFMVVGLFFSIIKKVLKVAILFAILIILILIIFKLIS